MIDINQKKIYVGDKGVSILFDCINPITDATSLRLDVLKPDGSEVSWVGGIYQTKYILFISASQNRSYQDLEFKDKIVKTNDTGLSINTQYNFIFNETQLTINTTGLTKVTYENFVTLLNTALLPQQAHAYILGYKIRITSDVIGTDVICRDASTNPFTFKHFKEYDTPIPGDVGDFDIPGDYVVQGYVITNGIEKACNSVVVPIHKKYS